MLLLLLLFTQQTLGKGDLSTQTKSITISI